MSVSAGGTERALAPAMNWTQIEGRWHTLAGQLKSQWAKLTDDDLANAAGKKDQLVGRLQERYGLVKDEAERQLDKWLEKLSPARADKLTPTATPPTQSQGTAPGDKPS
jgi:uncharacterized protein YjbJ (UPF0337 family)